MSVAGIDGLDAAFIAAVSERLARNERVRRRLPGGGRLHIDRRLPFLCVHRDPGEELTGDTPTLVTGEAAYLIAPRAMALHDDLQRLVQAIASVMVDTFGAFLVIEVWTGEGRTRGVGTEGGSTLRRPTFRLHTGSLAANDGTVHRFARALEAIPLRPNPLDVEVVLSAHASRPGLPPLFPPSDVGASGIHVLGLEVQPVHRQAKTGAPFPAVYRALRRGLTLALKQAAHHFAVTHSSWSADHFHALGRRTAVREVGAVDAVLTEIAHAFDFLLQVTPVNAAGARTEFERGGFTRAPALDYRPLVVDVDAMKRRLWDLRIDRLEDPTLAQVLGDSRDELDRKLTMLGDRDTPRFLYGSLALYGAVEQSLLRTALELLRRVPPPSTEGGEPDAVGEPPPADGAEPSVDAGAFAAMAESEIAWYRERHAPMAARVFVRGDLTGLMVSKGDLLIGSRLRLSASRADALLQHEVGTHVLTYYNGLAQPLTQLATGLAGYEELQEGLAVLAEHLTGGLAAARVRVLAGRVIAAAMVAGGADFVQTYRALTIEHGFDRADAFGMCIRVHRSGGFTKDAIYLRGLVGLLDHLQRDDDLEPLLVGKVALPHVPIVRELRWREYLQPPPLRPRYLASDGVRQRLERVRASRSVIDLITPTAAP